MTVMTDLLISQLADRTGIPATTLRFYETAGLLPAGRTPGGYRVYGEDAVERLGFIIAAKRLGLPLEQIAGLLHVWADGSCTQVRDSLPVHGDDRTGRRSHQPTRAAVPRSPPAAARAAWQG